MDFSIPWELEQLKELVGRFVADELRPLEERVDADDDVDHATMQRLRKKAVELGFYGFNLPSAIGGGGLTPLGEVIVGEVSGRTSMPLAETLGRLPSSLSFANPEQVEWLIKPILAGDKTACVALTEPDAGSDLGGLRTRGTQQGSKWTLNGSKTFISNAETSDYILVLTVTDPAASLRNRYTVFAVPRETPGLVFTHRFRKMGWHGYHIASFSLDNCVIDESHVIGAPGRGFETMMNSINTNRLYIASRCLGAAAELLRIAARYANERQTFGKRLGEHGTIQTMLADMDVGVETMRYLILAAAYQTEKGGTEARIAASRAKLYASETAGRVADSAVQILGGAGFMADFPVERMYRDLRGYRIGEGSSEMQRIQIARDLLARAEASS